MGSIIWGDDEYPFLQYLRRHEAWKQEWRAWNDDKEEAIIRRMVMRAQEERKALDRLRHQWHGSDPQDR